MPEAASKGDVDALRNELLRGLDGLTKMVAGGFDETRENFRSLETRQQTHGEEIAVLRSDTRRAHARVGALEAQVADHKSAIAVMRDRDARPAAWGAAAGGGVGLFLVGVVEVFRAWFHAGGGVKP